MSNFEIIIPFLEPLRQLFEHRDVTEILVNDGGAKVFFEHDGRMQLAEGVTLTESQLLAAFDVIASFCGDVITPERPALDARLEDGSRVTATIRPAAVHGPALTIRKFSTRYTLDQLVAVGSVPPEVARILVDAVRRKLNILVTGGTGTGKTTLLNALAAHIPDSERIIIIEDTAEIHIEKPNLLAFQARRQQERMSVETDVPALTIGMLPRHALRHHPNRILLGEVRGAEAWDLMQALNTGH
jgi:pilus assembly protein CpaF